MSTVETLENVHSCAEAGQLVITRSAWGKMHERALEAEDLRHALAGARSCAALPDGKDSYPAEYAGPQPRGKLFKVEGTGLSGEELVAVVAFEDGRVVVTKL